MKLEVLLLDSVNIIKYLTYNTKGWSAIPPELVRFLKNVPNGLIHPEMKRNFFPHYRPPPLPYLALVTGFSIPALLM